MSLAATAEPIGPLAYPCEDPPPLGQGREVAPGVLWLRMPWLDHVNVWAVRDDNGWAIVDTGLNAFETVTAWGNLLAASGRSRASVSRACWSRTCIPSTSAWPAG